MLSIGAVALELARLYNIYPDLSTAFVVPPLSSPALTLTKYCTALHSFETCVRDVYWAILFALGNRSLLVLTASMDHTCTYIMKVPVMYLTTSFRDSLSGLSPPGYHGNGHPSANRK